MSDPTLPYPTCEAPTCSSCDHLLNGALSGFECTSWTRGESCAATYAEEYQEANEITGTLMGACDEAAGDVVLEIEGSARLFVVDPLEDSSTGVSHESSDLSLKGSCGATCEEGYEAGGSTSTTF